MADDDPAEYRLATYGTLAPGRPNAYQLEALLGEWADGTVRGHLVERGWGAALGYPAMIPDLSGPEIAVQVFRSTDLPAHWTRLDALMRPSFATVTPVI